MNIIFGAVLSRYPLIPGSVWNRIQRVIGLKLLGHTVYYVEEVSESWCCDEDGNKTVYEKSVQRQLFSSLVQKMGIEGTSCQIYENGNITTGLNIKQIAEASRNCEMLINLSGHVHHPAIIENVKKRVYIDEDPVYTQLWNSCYGCDLGFNLHDKFFTVGQNIGTSQCQIPDCGIKWLHLLPPVVPSLWASMHEPKSNCYSTVASLYDCSDLEYNGVWYRAKYESLRQLLTLPQKSHESFEILFQHKDHTEEVELYSSYGWKTRDSASLDSLSAYQEYISSSKAEIGIAKNAHCSARSGWFSDRSSHFLVSGKPVLAQSTGLETILPTEEGFVTFRSIEEAIELSHSIFSKYSIHSRAAYEFAAEILDYRVVLPSFIEKALE